MTHPLITSDALLLSDEEPNHRNVLAATLGTPGRNPSLPMLARATGLREHTIVAAQKALEWRLNVADVSEDGTTATIALHPPRAIFDRPRGHFDRELGSPEFKRSTKLAWLRPDYDHDRAPYVALPGSVVDKLPRGTGRNASVLRIVALYYAREQLMRHAIQAEDEVVARRLGLWQVRNGVYEGPATKQVEAARKALLGPGILRVHDADAQPSPIYVMPGATPQRPENPDEFEPAWTKRYWPNLLFGEYDGFASEAQHAELQQLGRQLGQEAAENAIYAAGMERGDYIHADDALIALRSALAPETEKPSGLNGKAIRFERKGHPDRTERPGGSTLPVPEPKNSSTSGPASDVSATNGDGDEVSSDDGRKDSHIPRRSFLEWGDTFCFAEEPTYDRLLSWQTALLSRYGTNEAKGIWRDVFLSAGPQGWKILDTFRRNFGHLDPQIEDASAELNDILGDFQSVPD